MSSHCNYHSPRRQLVLVAALAQELPKKTQLLCVHSITATETSSPLIPLGQEELQLLDDASLDSGARSRDHELRTAPIFTRDAYNEAGFKNTSTQYGVLGRVLQT